MELYGSYTSPFVRHCRAVIREKNIECAFVEVTTASPENPSPTKKVPYLKDGQLGLSDSSSIIKHLREKSGDSFLAPVKEFDLYCLVNTLLDSAINVFLFEKLDQLLPEQSKYLARQTARVEAGLSELNAIALPRALPLGDAHLRLACFLAWGRFRKRFSLEGHPQLQEFLTLADTWGPFAETAPPEST
jgi:glutathione S-transferase